jgi:hypothetical protein
MKAKLMPLPNYETQSRACNCVWLQQIKAVMYKFEGQRDIFLAMGEARSTLDRCKKQQPHESNAVYFNQFKLLVNAFEHYGGTIGGDQDLIDSLINPTAPGHPAPSSLPGSVQTRSVPGSCLTRATRRAY